MPLYKNQTSWIYRGIVLSYHIFFGHIFSNQNVYLPHLNQNPWIKKILSGDIRWKCWHFLSDHLCEWHPILNSNFGTCKGWASNIYHHSYWRSANLIFSKLLSEYFARQTPSKIQPPNWGWLKALLFEGGIEKKKNLEVSTLIRAQVASSKGVLNKNQILAPASDPPLVTTTPPFGGIR